jgi:hypothetical protein
MSASVLSGLLTAMLAGSNGSRIDHNLDPARERQGWLSLIDPDRYISPSLTYARQIEGGRSMERIESWMI